MWIIYCKLLKDTKQLLLNLTTIQKLYYLLNYIIHVYLMIYFFW